MPGPTLTPDAKLDQLRTYVEHVQSNDKTKNDIIYTKAGHHTDQGRLIQSVIDSVGGKKRQERALSMLYQALENSYNTDIAAHVFDNMPDDFFNKGAALSTDLIDRAKRSAEARQSELADSSKTNENKIDIDTDNTDEDDLLGVKDEENIVLVDSDKNDSVINLKKNSPTINLKPNTVTSPKKKKGIWSSWFSKKPTKNAARGQNSLSDLDKTQMKLADTKNEIKKIKKTYRRMDDLRQTNVKKQKKHRKKWFQNKLKHQERLKLKKQRERLKPKKKANENEGYQPTQRHSKDDKSIQIQRDKLINQADNIKKMQYTMYVKDMEKGRKGVLKFNDLIKAASSEDNPRHLNSKEKKKVMLAIYGAFLNSDGKELTRQSQKLKTENIVLPAVRRFLPQLGMK